MQAKRRHALRLLVILAISAPAGGCLAGPTGRDPNDPVAKPTTVAIIGSIHDFHQKNPHYTEAVLRDIIVACRPDEILVEMPATMYGQPTVENGRLADDQGLANEGWAEQAAAEQLNVPIVPYDIDRREDLRRENDYYRRREQAGQRLEAWLQRHHDPNAVAALRALQAFREDVKQSIICLATKARPEVINSEAFDSIIRASWRIGDIVGPELMKAHPKQADIAREQAWLRQQWHVRNRIMAEKILARAKRHPGGTLAVIAGAEHRYILRDLLKDDPRVHLREYWE
jgi:hypothetical protein